MYDPYKHHKMRRLCGKTWHCAKPGKWAYSFRITWVPGALIITGDMGDMIVNHYSFTDPWAAAAWVNGAGWSYFMEKSQYGQEFDPGKTAKYFVERAYQDMRWSCTDTSWFERMNDELGVFCGGDPVPPAISCFEPRDTELVPCTVFCCPIILCHFSVAGSKNKII